MPLYTSALFSSHVDLLPYVDWDPQSNYEPASSEPMTTCSISKCASFWRTFVKSKWVMGWIDKGYDLVWVQTPPIAREMPNSKSALENNEFVTKAISDMVEASAASALPTCVIPTVVSPLGDVPKPHSEKLRLVVNMRYANIHLVKRVFNFEGLSDVADMANKGTIHCLLTLHWGITRWHYIQNLGVLSDSSGRVNITNTIAYLLGCPQPLGIFLKSFVS